MYENENARRGDGTYRWMIVDTALILEFTRPVWMLERYTSSLQEYAPVDKNISTLTLGRILRSKSRLDTRYEKDIQIRTFSGGCLWTGWLW